jgi:hypothetical protein
MQLRRLIAVLSLSLVLSQQVLTKLLDRRRVPARLRRKRPALHKIPGKTPIARTTARMSTVGEKQ